jgi:hypothetical protein
MVGLNPGPGPLDREIQDKEDRQQEAWDSNSHYSSWLDDRYYGYQQGKHPNQLSVQSFFGGINKIDSTISMENAIRKTPYINLVPIRSPNFETLDRTTVDYFLPQSLNALFLLKPEIIICFGFKVQNILNISASKQNIKFMHPLSILVNVGHFSTRGTLRRNTEWINNHFWPIAIKYYNKS